MDYFPEGKCPDIEPKFDIPKSPKGHEYEFWMPFCPGPNAVGDIKGVPIPVITSQPGKRPALMSDSHCRPKLRGLY